MPMGCLGGTGFQFLLHLHCFSPLSLICGHWNTLHLNSSHPRLWTLIAVERFPFLYKTRTACLRLHPRKGDKKIFPRTRDVISCDKASFSADLASATTHSLLWVPVCVLPRGAGQNTQVREKSDPLDRIQDDLALWVSGERNSVHWSASCQKKG